MLYIKPNNLSGLIYGAPAGTAATAHHLHHRQPPAVTAAPPAIHTTAAYSTPAAGTVQR